MITSDDALYINAAIKRLDSILLFINIATNLPEFVKRDAILLCLVDIGNLLNNGKYISLSEQIFKQFGGQILWDRLRDIRNDIMHRYYNNVASNCFDASFIADCQNLGRLLRAIILTAPQTYQDRNIIYNNADRNALGINLAIFHPLYTARHGTAVPTEISAIEKLLVLHRCFNAMKNCLALRDIEALSDDIKMMISQCLEFNKLLMDQILDDLKQTGNSINSFIIEQAREDNYKEGMNAILRSYDARNRRAHKLDLKKVALQETFTVCRKVISLHPIIMIALHLEGVNIFALLEAKNASILAAHQAQSKTPEILLLELNQLIAVCNALRFRSVNSSAYTTYPNLIAIRSRSQLDVMAIYSNTYNIQFPQTYEMAMQSIIAKLNGWPLQVAESATWNAVRMFLQRNLVLMAEQLAYHETCTQALSLARNPPYWNVEHRLTITPLTPSWPQDYFLVYDNFYREEVGTDPPPNWLTSLLNNGTIEIFESDYMGRLRRLIETQRLVTLPLAPVAASHQETGGEHKTIDRAYNNRISNQSSAAASSSSASKRKADDSSTAEGQHEVHGSATIISAALLTPEEAHRKLQKAEEKIQPEESKSVADKQKEEKPTSKEQGKSVELDKNPPSVGQGNTTNDHKPQPPSLT